MKKCSKIKKLKKKNKKLQCEIDNGHAFAYNMLPGYARPTNDMQNSLDEQLQLVYLYIEKSEKLIELLKKIIDDSKGDLNNPHKRVWAIRAQYGREASNLLDKLKQVEVIK